MSKYIVETFYTCSFKVKHYLENIDQKELNSLEKQLFYLQFKCDVGIVIY